MEPVHITHFHIDDLTVDRFGYLKPSAMLFFAQEAAGQHCISLGADYETLAQRRLFWAVIRQRLTVTRLPRRGETVRVETWPMPTTRVAYPRCVVAYDEAGQECFRSMSLWVLMDMDTRAMVLPGRSGVTVEGILRGIEPATPAALTPAHPTEHYSRTVRFTDLDRNGHMNNTRYMDWVADLCPSALHGARQLREMSLCYFAESLEGDALDLRREAMDPATEQVDIHRERAGKDERIFSARLTYDLL